MSRFVNLRLVLALGMAGALSVSYFRLGAQPPPAKLKIEPVKEDLYNIVNDGGNVGVLVTKDGVIIIDDKFSPDFEEIVSKVKSVTDQPIRYVLNTHHHGDHTGGNEKFLSAQAEIIAHRNARANMVAGNQPGPQRITFSDEMAIYLGGKEVRMKHFGRGHTNGDAIVYFPALKTIHAGDLFTRGAPFIDYKGGGSCKAWTTTLEAALTWDFDTVIPGHGPVGTRADLQQHIKNIATMRDRMSDLINKGVSRDLAGDQLKIDDLGWTSSPLSKAAMPSLYDEMAVKN